MRTLKHKKEKSILLNTYLVIKNESPNEIIIRDPLHIMCNSIEI